MGNALENLRLEPILKLLRVDHKLGSILKDQELTL